MDSCQSRFVFFRSIDKIFFEMTNFDFWRAGQAKINKNWFRCAVIFCLLANASLSLTYGQFLPHFQGDEEVSVGFVTSLREQSIHEHEYHIIEIHRPDHGHSFRVHLTRSVHLLSSEFRFEVRSGDSVAQRLPHENHTPNLDSPGDVPEDNHCVYSGVVSNGSFQGDVVLSACGDKPGFSGVIMTSSATYALERSEIEEDIFPIPHKLSLVDTKDQDGACTCGGTIYADVPEDKSIPENPLEKAKSRHERSTGGGTVELALFGDETFVSRMKKELKATTAKAILGFLYTLVHIMSILYDSTTLDDRIQFKIVSVELLTKNPASLKTSHKKLTDILESFCKFAQKQNPSGTKWDHAIMFTGEDLREGLSTAPIGVAYTRGACTTNYMCSVVELDKGFKMGTAMTHEVGHNLGMEHDGEAMNTHCDSKRNIMAPALLDQTDWSRCSSKNLRDYLSLLQKGTYSRPNCLKKSSSLSKKKNYDFNKSKKLPGQQFPPASQCALAIPDNPVPVTADLAPRFKLTISSETNICKGLYCTDSLKMFASHIHPALEGSDCDANKWCIGGQCVKKTSKRSGKRG